MPKGTQHYLLVVCLGVALVPALALGQPVRAPAPSVEPQAVAAQAGHADVTSASADADARPITAAVQPDAVQSDAGQSDAIARPWKCDVGTLKAGLDALAAGDVACARKYRDQLPDDALDRHILTWAIAMSGQPDVSSDEIADCRTGSVAVAGRRER